MTLFLITHKLQCLLRLVREYIAMHTVNKHKDKLLTEFYLDADNITVRRATDGWRNKWNVGDVVEGYKLCSHGYQGVHIPRTRTTVNLTHLILILRGVDIPNDMVVDHIDGNTLNNAADNLRIVKQIVNCKNRKQNSNNSTGHNGITWNKATNAYTVRLYVKGVRKYLGQRETLTEARILRDSYKEIRKQDDYTSRHGFEGATTIPKGSTAKWLEAPSN